MAEVGNDNCPHSTVRKKLLPRDTIYRSRFHSVRHYVLSLSFRYLGVLRGRGRREHLPEREPHRAQAPKDPEHARPVVGVDEARGEREARDGASVHAAVHQRQAARPFHSRYPSRQHRVHRRHGHAFADAHACTRGEQGGEAQRRRRWREHRGGRPPDHTETKNLLASNSIRKKPTQNLGHEVAPEEGRLHDAHGRAVPRVLLRHGENGDAHVDSVHVAQQERHKTQPHHGVAPLPPLRLVTHHVALRHNLHLHLGDVLRVLHNRLCLLCPGQPP
mmetsp:Transcript_28614/g.54723  ORF Transcript_28614/g.54723 Transcript_28614/m.54723 type:complete len:275 (+) Transcript_28614:1284-2108(+)